MKKRKQIALNRLFNVFIILGLIAARVAVECFVDNDIAWGIVAGAVALIAIVIPAIFTPYCYAFDVDGVSLRYIFLPVERYLWKDVYNIEVEDTGMVTGAHSPLMFFLCGSVFAIKGTNVGKHRIYMQGYIRKTFRTKHLLEKYWDGTITGYVLDDLKEWLRKRKAKKQSEISRHLNDEIISMEREVRVETREWLKPFIDQAKKCDLDVRSKYTYMTKGFEESNSRPNEGYTYKLVVEISRFNEADESRIAVIDIDLIYVRLGKTAYRGVKNKCAKEDLETTFPEVLDEIKKVGIDAYYSDVY